ncbi:hypothetical protein DFO45_2256 [Azorhizobium sp. AG788]|nr:hypothetical protein DFO45_2256 [Azorhizobium sp. AG788]
MAFPLLAHMAGTPPHDGQRRATLCGVREKLWLVYGIKMSRC